MIIVTGPYLIRTAVDMTLWPCSPKIWAEMWNKLTQSDHWRL
jgi:hypothetical protein